MTAGPPDATHPSRPTYHDQEDVIGFCADYRHPWGCQDDEESAVSVALAGGSEQT